MIPLDRVSVAGGGTKQRPPTRREMLGHARDAAHDCYLAACRVLENLDETADDAWVHNATTARDHAWNAYSLLVQEAA